MGDFAAAAFGRRRKIPSVIPLSPERSDRERGTKGGEGSQKPLERIRCGFCPIASIRDAREGIASAAIAASQ